MSARDFLCWESIPGLHVRYLPTTLSMALAPGDLESLAPFEDALRKQLEITVDETVRNRRMSRLSPQITIELAATESLPEGSEPLFSAVFPEGCNDFSWTPRASLLRETPSSEQSGALYELISTIAYDGGTAVQMQLRVWFGQELPGRLLDPCFGAATFRVDPASGRIVGVDGTELTTVWKGHVSSRELATNANITRDDLHAMTSAPVWRFLDAESDATELLWAPRGALVIGREQDQVHCVPRDAPRALSSAHLAMVHRPGGTLAVVDLNSTNGTYIGNYRLEPSRETAISVPCALTIGKKGAMVLEIRKPAR